MSADLQNQSADKKYYASGNKSVIHRTIADSKLVDRHLLTPNATPKAVDPRYSTSSDMKNASSDKYYANNKEPTPQPVAMPGAIPTHAQTLPPMPAPGPAAIINILTKTDLPLGLERVLAALQQGQAAVQVALGSTDLVTRFRTALELAVGREAITEDQARDVLIGLAPPAATPPTLEELNDPALQQSAREFLDEEDDETLDIAATPVTPTIVDTEVELEPGKTAVPAESAAVETPAVEATATPEDEDEDEDTD